MSLRTDLIGLWETKSERDKQVSIGASNLSNPCARCLAQDMMGVPEGSNPFIMGAKIGTAVHMYLEEEVLKQHPEWHAEQKMVLGEIPGYGTVGSTADAYSPEHKAVIDFKTTTRDKLKKIKETFDLMEGKVQAYVAQTHLYAMGKEKQGYPVEQIAIYFIPRDSVTLDDLWVKIIPYDRDYAHEVWDRGVRLWRYLEEDGDIDDLPSDEHCFTCSYYM